MKKIFIIVITFLAISTITNAQERLIDASDNLPISAASILDAAGNMVGFTLTDGSFSEIPPTAYPITISCVGYERLIIESPENKAWKMTPMVYELDEVVIAPVDRNILKQTFYVREYFSVSSPSDTVTFFLEHMANRFVPISDNARFRGNKSLRKLSSRCYASYNVADKDSVAKDPEQDFPSIISVSFLEEEEVKAPEDFTSSIDGTRLYEEPGKSGMFLVQKQNSQTFTTTTDGLAKEDDHAYSPWALKPIGCSMTFRQLYKTEVYRTNEDGIYQPQDLIEASFVMEADGKGWLLRNIVNSKEPVTIYSMLEIYTVENKFLSGERAKEEYRNPPTDVQFVIPENAPALNAATLRLIERANAIEQQ